MFLLLYRFWSRYTFVDQLVITKHVSSTFNWDPEHMKFVSKWFNQFNRILQCSEFTTKRACFNCVLPLAEHDNLCHTTKQHYASLGFPSQHVSTVLRINIIMGRHQVITWLRHVPRNSFFHSTIKVLPVKLLEPSFVNLWMSMI